MIAIKRKQTYWTSVPVFVSLAATDISERKVSIITITKEKLPITNEENN